MEGRPDADDVRRLVRAIASLGSDVDLRSVLQRLVEAATDLVDARYGALGILNADGTALTSFITAGIDEAGRAAIGELPKGHGILGLLIVDPQPLRLDDLRQHPESFGFPVNHPPMTSFLGVPVVVRGEVFGNLYLTDKAGGAPFTSVDEELAVGLAAAAAVAVENARLLAKTVELDIAHERERIARDLHDTVIQRLFATGLSLQSAARLCQDDTVVDRIQLAVDELDVTVRDVRATIFELNPPPSSSSGLRRKLLAVGDELADALGYSPTFRFEGPVDTAVPDLVANHVIAVVREGLANIARHAGSPTADVRVVVRDGTVEVTLEDAGRGPRERDQRGHGLANLRGRAAEVGGAFTMGERPGGGTAVSWSAPVLPG